MKSAIELVEELGGTECQCGRTKKRSTTFCSKCFYSLPKDQQRALYRRLGDGYEEAYAVALATLTQEIAQKRSEGGG